MDHTYVISKFRCGFLRIKICKSNFDPDLLHFDPDIPYFAPD